MMLEAAVLAALAGPARLQVTADEFRLALSRRTLRAGPAIVELVNFGEDEHDLVLRRKAAAARSFRIPSVRPGKVGEVELRLAPGRYALWCSIADHRRRGMSATLTVRRG